MSDLAKRIASLTPEQRALLARRMKSGTSGAGPAAEPEREPLAVIGLGCRFPGGADSPEAFWRLLRDGVDAITEVPSERWEPAALYDADYSVPGKMNTRWGGFLRDVDRFDAGFFGIAPREAARMDPQQRMLLEVAWEALEDAGQPLETVSGSAAGVFVGIHSQSSEYCWLQIADPGRIDTYTGTGTAHSIVANRLSYAFDLRGPSVAVDTACSSSLVAVHLACQSLRNRECDLALAGGVNLVLSPEMTIAFSKLQMMAADGRCKTFDARADGFVRGEGCGVVVLKRLSEALADGDDVLAVIRGSAVNQDGRTNGLTAPSGLSQEAVVRRALKDAGLAAADVTYVEAHGTGTALGDPIEVEALAAVFSGPRPEERSCALGSVKTNLGHLESAAGIAGLIKVVLCLRHQAIPPHLHFTGLNPHIRLEGTPFVIAPEGRPWPRGGEPRCAGVSSFGFGGTNAHVVLAEAPPVPAPAPRSEPRVLPVPLSARSPEALRALASAWVEALRAEPGPGDSLAGVDLGDIARAAALRRSHHDHRLAVVARSPEDLAARLRGFLEGERSPGVAAGAATESRRGLAFVFSGQGPQWQGMARELMAREPVFSEVVESCDALVRRQANFSLIEELGAGEDRSRLDQTEVAQPAIFALQVAVAALWRSWGVVPEIVIGHSVGEVAAAHVAGILGIEDAVHVVVQRARLMQRATGGGRMASVGLGAEEAGRAIAGHEGRLSVAAVNGPATTVLSGETAALEKVLEELRSRGVDVRMLKVSYAFHSPQMEPLQPELVAALAGIRPRPALLPMISTVSGRAVEGPELDAAYWGRNIRAPVAFAAAVEVAARRDAGVFLEIGPHPVLGAALTECLGPASDALVLASLRRGQEERATLLATLASLYVRGFAVDWKALAGGDGPCAKLPSYPWQRQRHWLEPAGAKPRAAGDGEAAGDGSRRHPVLGRRIDAPVGLFESRLSPATLAELDGHRLWDTPVMPATTLLAMAVAAAREVLGGRRHVLNDVVLHEVLAFPDGEPRRVQLMLGEEDASGTRFGIFSSAVSVEAAEPACPAQPRAGGESWTRHASGRVREGAPVSAEAWDLEAARRRCLVEESGEDLYRRLGDRGFRQDAVCRGLDRLWKGQGEALGRLRVPGDGGVDDGVHGAALMSAFQLCWAVLPEGEGEEAWFPTALEGFHAEPAPAAARWAHVRLRPGSPARTVTADLKLLGEDGVVLAAASGVVMRRAGRELLLGERAPREWMYEVVWEPRPKPAVDASGSSARPHAVERIAAAAPALEHHWTGGGAARYDAIHPGLEALATEYVVRCLRDLGVDFRPGVRRSLVSLGVAPGRRRLLGRFLEMLVEDGVLRVDGDEVEVRRTPASADPERRRGDLERAFPEFDAELALLARCGPGLADVLRGRCDPLGLLFPDGSPALVEKLYQDSPLFASFNALVRDTVARAVSSLPADAPVRILELGAGTGGTTAHVLPCLPRDRTEYVFTDLSPAFLTRARDKFAAYPFVRYALLDVEGGLEEQGFAAHAYDIVLAANVLHASRDLGRSLRLAARLLAPSGALVLFEVTSRQRWIDATFGLTDGWWRFEDTGLRPAHPLLTVPRWRAALRDAGLDGGLSLPPGDEARQAVIVARAAAPATDSTARTTGSWVVLGDRSGVGDALVQGLRSRGLDARLVPAGGSGRDGGAHADLSRPEAVAAVVRGARDVVHLWALDTPPGDEPGTAELEARQRLLCGSVLHLARAMAAAGSDQRLWIATRGAQPVGSQPVSASQAPLWGLGRVIALENPRAWGGMVDLDPSSAPADSAAALLEEVLGGDDEDQAAFRGGRRYVPRLQPAQPLRAQPPRFDPGAAYLVTGGLGGLGLKVARWIVEHGGRHLVLVSRRGVPPREGWPALAAGTDAHRRAAAARSLEEMGARVLAVAADVGDASAMEALFARFGTTEPPLRGIVHAAAELGSCRLADMDADGLLSVLRPKVLGAFLLDRLSRGLELDFFVMFSSTTALWGATGLAHYAAANLYLDTLAHRRRAEGLPGLSVNWGTWDEMRTFSTEEKDAVSRFGLRPMAASRALLALADLIGSAVAQRTVAAVDWGVLKDAYEARRRRPFLSRVGSQPAGAATAPAPPGLLARFQAAAADERPYLLAEHVRGEVARVLGLDPAQPLETDRGFFEIGMDSLTSAELRRRLEVSLGRSLPPTLTFNYPNVDALTGYLAGVMIPGSPPPAARPQVASPAATSAEPVAATAPSGDLSEEELTAMLADRLRRLQ